MEVPTGAQTSSRTEPPVDEVISTVVDLWRDLFEDPEIDADSDFIALGGTSLIAVKFRERVRDRLGRDLDLQEIFFAPTPREIAPSILESPAWQEAEAEPTADAADESSDLDALLARLLRLPTTYRDFRVPEPAVRLQYGLDAALLHELRDRGLPFVERDGTRVYDHADLHFVGLRLEKARPYLTTIRAWRDTLLGLSSSERPRVKVTFVPQLDGTDRKPGLVRLPDREVETTLVHNEPAASGEFDLRSSWPPLPDELVRAVATVEELEFFDSRMLTDRPGGKDAAREAGLTSCGTTALILGQQFMDAGFRVRAASGLLLSVPYSTEHTWLEVEVDGTWTPVDPTIVRVMQRFAALDPTVWPAHRAIGAILLRVGIGRQAVLSSEDVRVPGTFMTSIVGA